MTLTFTQENGLYVAEFEATAPFSIHLERPRGGFINMLQRSVDSGTFVAVKNFNPNYNATQVIDADCGQGAVYPKWIRLESAVEPSVAEVTFEDEQSGGGAGAEYVNDLITEYYSIDWDKATELGYGSSTTFEVMLKAVIGGFALVRGEVPGSELVMAASYFYQVGISYAKSVGFAKFKTFNTETGWGDINTLQDLLTIYAQPEMSAIFIPITKEEFYQGVEEA